MVRSSFSQGSVFPVARNHAGDGGSLRNVYFCMQKNPHHSVLFKLALEKTWHQVVVGWDQYAYSMQHHMHVLLPIFFSVLSFPFLKGRVEILRKECM